MSKAMTDLKALADALDEMKRGNYRVPNAYDAVIVEKSAAALRKADARIENLETSDNIHRGQAHLWKLAASDSAEALRTATALIAALKSEINGLRLDEES